MLCALLVCCGRVISHESRVYDGELASYDRDSVRCDADFAWLQVELYWTRVIEGRAEDPASRSVLARRVSRIALELEVAFFAKGNEVRWIEEQREVCAEVMDFFARVLAALSVNDVLALRVVRADRFRELLPATRMDEFVVL